MSIDFTPKLTETASKVAVTRNEYNDIVYGATTSSACLYRDITDLERSSNRELVNMDGYLWLGSTETVVRGDVYYHASEGYLRIERVTRAKDLLLDNIVRFIKCEVTKQRQVS